MQNLRNVEQRILTIPEDRRLTAVTYDLTDDSVICAFGPTEDDALLSLKRLRPRQYAYDEAESITAWDAVCPRPDLSHDSVVSLHHFSDTQQIVLILAGGDIVLVSNDDANAVEIVGSVDEGIAAASWSPDEELLVLATTAKTLLLMTRSFDNTATIKLTLEDLKVSTHVSVGWGKVETQFKGRGARALRDPTIPEHVDIGKLSDADDDKTTISWRGDGQYFAINSVVETEPDRRVIRVYSREGILESVSEAVDNMESALAWKPSGQTLASIQRTSDATQVIFFERNGLRHGEFDLRLNQAEQLHPIHLQWNADSSVLAVTSAGKVQLWTTSNYHWYLKQEIRLTPVDNHAKATLHPERPLHLACFTAQQLNLSQYSSQCAMGSTASPFDDGLVATIDGTRLAVTPLRIANIPPPMAYEELDLQSAAIDVSINPTGKQFAVLHHDAVAIFEYDYDVRPAKRARMIQSLPLRASSDVPRQVVLAHEGALNVFSGKHDSVGASRTEWQQLDGEGQISELDTSPVFSSVAVGASNIAILTADGSMLSRGTFSPPQLPTSCLDAHLWTNQDRTIAFGRTAGGMLHIRSETQQLKINGCTSYIVTPSHLIFTTSQHLLKFVHLQAELDIPLDEPEKDERCRSIERGAKIVTVMPSIFALVLQMPRGNLETIYPRALVLAGIRQCLSNRDYKKAFTICRSQRVDMNILFDYAPDQLLADVELFIKQVQKVEYIDLFLSSLTAEDVTKTIYRETLRTVKTDQLAVSSPGKVNTVCQAFVVALSKLDGKYLQSIITAHVSKDPPDLESGLQLISLLRKEGNERSIEQAVEHICFLGDVNRLYDTALGMYDLEVTILVAQQSQKDPREYLPYVQGLREMSTHRMRFTIDNDLKRYGKALLSLHNLDVFDELLKYVDRHELYAAAIELYRHDKTRLHQLMRLHAEFLLSRNRFSDAGTAFEFIVDHRAAYEAFRGANLWRETLTTAALVPVTATELQDLAQALSDSLIESKDFASAALIQLDYLDDLAGAVRLYCKGYSFAEAMRLAVSRQQSALLEQVVDNSLIECSGSMTELLAEMRTQLNNQVPRLRDLRKRKIEEPMAFLDTGENENGDFPDNLSVAPTDASTSGGTFMTRYTNRSTGTLASNATRQTSKNRRREERKRARGKKGTVYEEEYLVNSISRLIERLNDTSADVTQLVQGLMRRSMRERAVAVEKAMLEVHQLCEENMAEVYESASPLQIANNMNSVLDAADDSERPTGGQGVQWDALRAAQQKIAAPVLKAFERLSLLAA